MLLKELTEINGVSGSEEDIRKYIINKINGLCDSIKVDSIGNVIAYKKSRGQGKKKVMLSAHMDEVGLMITGYGESGILKFKPVGGIDERILPGKRVVVGPDKIPGVIGMRPVHMQEKEERAQNVKLKSLYIDIGAQSGKEAEAAAPLGEYAAFSSDYVEFGNGLIKAKALDDRVGCAILVEALKESYEFELYACFTVQEETGLRGSEVAAYTVGPDLALVVEGTTCSDVPGVEHYDHSTKLGKGAALTIMDRTSYVDKELLRFIERVAQKHNIKYQFKQTTTGGNDAGKIQVSGAGVKVASISVPCRYIHSPVSVMSSEDFEATKLLTVKTLMELPHDLNLKV